jgi:hypothetical protein
MGDPKDRVKHLERDWTRGMDERIQALQLMWDCNFAGDGLKPPDSCFGFLLVSSVFQCQLARLPRKMDEKRSKINDKCLRLSILGNSWTFVFRKVFDNTSALNCHVLKKIVAMGKFQYFEKFSRLFPKIWREKCFAPNLLDYCSNRSLWNSIGLLQHSTPNIPTLWIDNCGWEGD